MPRSIESHANEDENTQMRGVVIFSADPRFTTRRRRATAASAKRRFVTEPFLLLLLLFFFYRVLPSFTGFYLVFIGFLGFLHGLAQFLVLRSAQRRLATEPLFLPSFTEFYRVLPSFTGFYWI